MSDKGKFSAISSDHRYLAPVNAIDLSFTALLKVLDRGNCYLKIAGYYETSRSG